MVTVLRLYPREIAKEKDLVKLATGELLSLKGSPWKPTPGGYVWKRFEGRSEVARVRFYVTPYRLGEPLLVKIWSVKRGRGPQRGYPEARNVSQYIQWIIHRARRYIKRIEIDLPP